MIWALVLMVIGILFVIAEVFFPSLGAFGLIAGLCILGADLLAFQEGQVTGWIFIGTQIVLIPLVIRFAFQALPRLPFGRRMMLDGPTNDPRPAVPRFDHLVGQEGLTLTELRPSGTATFGSDRLSVVAQGGMIEAGARVRVIETEGNEIRVMRVLT